MNKEKCVYKDDDCIKISDTKISQIIEEIEETPQKAYVCGDSKYAASLVPVLKKHFNFIKVYELSGLQYICTSNEADINTKKLLLSLYDETWNEINKKRQLAKDICNQLYGCDTRVEYAIKKRSDYAFPGSALANEIGLAFYELDITTEEKYEYVTSNLSRGLVDYYMDEQIQNNEINKINYYGGC